MQGHWPCSPRNGILPLFSLLLLASSVYGISYRCENNQVLIVQSFGNDTIRMHCQRLNLCGYDKMDCAYDREQPNCGGKLNFVAHVNQATATGPVHHTCCELKLADGKQNVPAHNGNDCFVYELPDGTTASEKSKNSEDITVLKSANQIPEQFGDGYVGYRMRLFMLKNKSPPTLIVKAIERVAAGYRVTICRPRCDKFNKESELGGQEIQNEEVVPSHPKPVDGKSEQWTTGKDGTEYQALQWGSWSSSTWETWKTTEYTEEDEKKAGASGTRLRTSSTKGAKSEEDSSENPSSLVASASASASSGAGSDSDTNGTSKTNTKDSDAQKGEQGSSSIPQQVVNHNNINVSAKGGKGGHASITLPNQGNNGNGDDGKRKSGLDENDNLPNGRSSNGRVAGHDAGDDGLKRVSEDSESDEEDDRVYGRRHGKKSPHGRQHRIHHTGKVGESPEDSEESSSELDKNGKDKKKPNKSSHGKTTRPLKGSGEDDLDNNEALNEKDSSEIDNNDNVGKDGKSPDDKGKGDLNRGKNKNKSSKSSHGKTTRPLKESKKPSNEEDSSELDNNANRKAGIRPNRLQTEDSEEEDSSEIDDSDENKEKPNNKSPHGKTTRPLKESEEDDLDNNEASNEEETSEVDKQSVSQQKGGKRGKSKHPHGKGDGGSDKKDVKSKPNKNGKGHGKAKNANGKLDGDNLNDGDSDKKDEKSKPNKNGKGHGKSKHPHGKAKNANGKLDGNNLNNGDSDKKPKESDKKATISNDASGKETKISDDENSQPNKVTDGSDSDKEPKDSDKSTGEPVTGDLNKQTGDSSANAQGLKPEENGEDANSENKKGDGSAEANNIGDSSGRKEGGHDEGQTSTPDNIGDLSGRKEGGHDDGQESTPDDDSKNGQEGKGDEATGNTGVDLPDQNVTTNLETPESSEEDGDESLESSGNGEAETDDCDELNGVVFGGDESSGEGSGEGSGQETRKKCGSAKKEENNQGGGSSEEKPDKTHHHGPFVQARPRAHAAVNRQSRPNNLEWENSPGHGPSPSCFSGDTQVETANGPKLMRDLQVGDHVLVPAAGNALRYERVAMFYHREPETRVKFVRLQTESGKILSLTALHLLPFGDCSTMQESNFGADGVEEWMRKARFAHKAQVGDCVLSLDDQRNVQVERITKVGRELSKGIYSPVTVEGSIITNNILSSCFSQIESHAAQKMAFDALMFFYSSFGYLSNMAYGAVQEIPTLLQYFHTFSFYLLPFAKY